MPKFLEKKLRAHVPSGVDADRYVYGAMNNMGAMKGSKETAKGKRMEAKHERDQAKKYKGESHSYDSNRKNRKVQSRYK